MELPDWDNPSQDDWRTFRAIEEEHYPRSALNIELAHRCFTSMGLAAQHMPQLESATFWFTFDPKLCVHLFKDQSTGKMNVEWTALGSFSGYRPDRRVQDAWGVGLDDIRTLSVGSRGCSFGFRMERWPPTSSENS